MIWKDRGVIVDIYYAVPKGWHKTGIGGGPHVEIETSTCRVTSVYSEQ